eukprot:6252520-Alexandrium_andersonii.AAC.1
MQRRRPLRLARMPLLAAQAMRAEAAPSCRLARHLAGRLPKPLRLVRRQAPATCCGRRGRGCVREYCLRSSVFGRVSGRFQ